MVPKPPHSHICFFPLLFIEALQGWLRSQSRTRKEERRSYTSFCCNSGCGPPVLGVASGGPIEDLPIIEVSNLYLALFSVCSLMASKAATISAVTSLGHLSQTTTSLQTILARWYFNLFMPPDIWAVQKLQMTLWSSLGFTQTQYFHAGSRGLLALGAMESGLQKKVYIKF